MYDIKSEVQVSLCMRHSWLCPIYCIACNIIMQNDCNPHRDIQRERETEQTEQNTAVSTEESHQDCDRRYF